MSSLPKSRRLAAMVCEALADVHAYIGSEAMCRQSAQLDWSIIPPDIHLFSQDVHFGIRAWWVNGGPVGQVTAIAQAGEMTRVAVDLISRSLSNPRIAEEYVANVLPEFMHVAGTWAQAARNAVRDLAGRVGHLTSNTTPNSFMFAGPVST